MTEIQFNDPCILFALRRESAPFRRHFRSHQTFPSAPCRARFCGRPENTVLVLETGMGAANVARALDWLLSEPPLDKVPYRPRLLIFAGFAGALTETLHVGDIVLADRVIDTHGNAWRTTWPGWDDGGTTTLLTADHIIATPEEKRRLGAEHRAVAVDMESALFASRCAQAGIPFGCLRAISDEVTTPLSPALTSVLTGGAVSPWRLGKAILRQPSMIRDLLRLARDTKCAGRRLAEALREMLQLAI